MFKLFLNVIVFLIFFSVEVAYVNCIKRIYDDDDDDDDIMNFSLHECLCL